MSAKITVGGVQIIVDTTELGEALRQLQPWFREPKTADPKPTKGDGDHLHSDETGSVVSQGTGHPPKAPRPLRPPASPMQPIAQGDAAPADRAIALFRAIQDHRASGGLLPEEVMRIVGAGHPKGTGSRMQGINRVLRDLGLDSQEVYRNDRGPLGDRVWTGGPKLDEAVRALEQHHLK